MTKEIRCPNCKKKYCEATESSHIKAKCPRCGENFTYANGSYQERLQNSLKKK